MRNGSRICEILVGAVGIEDTSHICLQDRRGLESSMFSRYNVIAEEDLREATEKVTKYNETESQKVSRSPGSSHGDSRTLR